jgi:hypothetical protein
MVGGWGGVRGGELTLAQHLLNAGPVGAHSSASDSGLPRDLCRSLAGSTARRTLPRVRSCSISAQRAPGRDPAAAPDMFDAVDTQAPSGVTPCVPRPRPTRRQPVPTIPHASPDSMPGTALSAGQRGSMPADQRSSPPGFLSALQAGNRGPPWGGPCGYRPAGYFRHESGSRSWFAFGYRWRRRHAAPEGQVADNSRAVRWWPAGDAERKGPADA